MGADVVEGAFGQHRAFVQHRSNLRAAVRLDVSLFAPSHIKGCIRRGPLSLFTNAPRPEALVPCTVMTVAMQNPRLSHDRQSLP
jgi:hypothetical protein